MLKTSPKTLFRATAIACVASCLAAATADAQPRIDFEVSAGKVIPSEDFAVKVSVLGAAIEQNGVPNPVTLDIQIGEANYQPFGPLNNPEMGNVNNNKPARHFTLQETFDSNTEVVVTGISWQTGSTDIRHKRTTQEMTSYVQVLRHGDPVPDVEGYRNQSDVAEFVRDYVDPDTNTMLLHENQVIYLFELGTDDLASDAADFQDLVVLVTLGESPEQLKYAELLEAMYD